MQNSHSNSPLFIVGAWIACIIGHIHIAVMPSVQDISAGASIAVSIVGIIFYIHNMVKKNKK
jgi:hypothetical protein